MNAIKNTPETKNGIFSPTIILIKVYSMKTVPAYANKGMFLEGIFRELLNISLTENNLQLLTVDLRAYLFSQVKLLYYKA